VLVVDPLEIVEVDEEQGPARSVPVGALPTLNEALSEQGAIGETGQPVANGALLEDPLLPLKVQLAAMRSEK
jgi:hypothetical protein